MTKKIASSLKSVLDTEALSVVLNRTEDIVPVAEELAEGWGLDLYSRKPGPAVNANGEFVGTDLDMSTFLYALADRKAVISIPYYKGMRARKEREGERLANNNNRYGKILGLFSNQKVFSFGLLMNDMSVVQTEGGDESEGAEVIGAFRNFALVGVDGTWHKGWHRIEFSPSAQENDFLTKNSLWTGNTIILSQFVHPNRWVSFYGAPYFITKSVCERLEDEAEFLYSEMKRLKEEGVQYSEKKGAYVPKEYGKTEKIGKEVKKQVTAFEACVDIPEYEGEYKKIKSTPDELSRITERRNTINNNLLKRLRFATRSVEYAFNKFGTTDGKDRLPTWIEAKWERDYVPDGKRTSFNRLVLFQPKVGQRGVALRYRQYLKTESVAAE